MFRRWFVTAVVMSVAIGGYGMWRLTTPERPIAVIVAADTLRCATPYPIGPFPKTRLATVPDDFVPTAAVTCDAYVGGRVAADRTVGYVERRWEGDFSRAVELLNRRSEHQTWFPGGCGEEYSLAVLGDFWLIDDRGRAVQPGHPRDSCGLPKPGGLAAVEESMPVGETEHRIALSEDQIFTVSHCRPTYRLPTPGTERSSSLLSGSSFCRFSGTTFVGTTSTMESTDSHMPAPDCDIVATEVASSLFLDPTTNQERLLTIELDGCRRAIFDGYAPLRAPDALLASLR